MSLERAKEHLENAQNTNLNRTITQTRIELDAVFSPGATMTLSTQTIDHLRTIRSHLTSQQQRIRDAETEIQDMISQYSSTSLQRIKNDIITRYTSLNRKAWHLYTGIPSSTTTPIPTMVTIWWQTKPQADRYYDTLQAEIDRIDNIIPDHINTDEITVRSFFDPATGQHSTNTINAAIVPSHLGAQYSISPQMWDITIGNTTISNVTLQHIPNSNIVDTQGNIIRSNITGLLYQDVHGNTHNILEDETLCGPESEPFSWTFTLNAQRQNNNWPQCRTSRNITMTLAHHKHSSNGNRWPQHTTDNPVTEPSAWRNAHIMPHIWFPPPPISHTTRLNNTTRHNTSFAFQANNQQRSAQRSPRHWWTFTSPQGTLWHRASAMTRFLWQQRRHIAKNSNDLFSSSIGNIITSPRKSLLSKITQSSGGKTKKIATMTWNVMDWFTWWPAKILGEGARFSQSAKGKKRWDRISQRNEFRNKPISFATLQQAMSNDESVSFFEHFCQWYILQYTNNLLPLWWSLSFDIDHNHTTYSISIGNTSSQSHKHLRIMNNSITPPQQKERELTSQWLTDFPDTWLLQKIMHRMSGITTPSTQRKGAHTNAWFGFAPTPWGNTTGPATPAPTTSPTPPTTQPTPPAPPSSPQQPTPATSS